MPRVVLSLIKHTREESSSKMCFAFTSSSKEFVDNHV